MYGISFHLPIKCLFCWYYLEISETLKENNKIGCVKPVRLIERITKWSLLNYCDNFPPCCWPHSQRCWMKWGVKNSKRQQRYILKQLVTALPRQTIVEHSEKSQGHCSNNAILSLWTKALVERAAGRSDDSDQTRACHPARLLSLSWHVRWCFMHILMPYLLMSLIDLKASSISPMVR